MSRTIRKIIFPVVLVFVVISSSLAYADMAKVVKIYEHGTTNEPYGAQFKYQDTSEDNSPWSELLDSGSSITAKNNHSIRINFKIPEGNTKLDDYVFVMSRSIPNPMEFFVYPSSVSEITHWPLWPISPPTPFDLIIFDPLSFTIVGSNRNYLSWSEPIANNVGTVWGGKVYLSDLDASTMLTTADVGVFDTRNLGIWQYPEEACQSLSSLAAADIGVLPEYIAEWVTVSADTGSVDVPNQEVVNDWLSAWRGFLRGKTKGGDTSYIGDTGHSSPTMVYVDNIWIANLPGYRSYKAFLKDAYQTDLLGEGIILIPTNEGVLHAFSMGSFEEQWAIIPFPGQALGYYQEARREASETTEEPRMNLLDGPLGFADIEGATEKTWRRIVVGTAGTGLTLENKPAGFYAKEYVADDENGTTDTLAGNLTAQYGAKTQNNPHFWGIYAVNLADNGLEPKVTPSGPELLWSVSTVYFEEDGTEKGAIFVNGTRYNRDSEEVDAFEGFRDIRLSCARPVVGVTEDDSGNRQWHVVFAGITHKAEFHLYDLNAETGEMLQDINLGNFPRIYKDGESLLVDGDLSAGLGGNDSLSGIIWDERFEWKFPTRIGAIAKDKVRDEDPENLTTVQLYRTPRLKEVYVHLSNGALYRWDVSQPPSGNNPVMVALSLYQSDYTYTDDEGTVVEDNALVSGPSTQDFDGTYLTPLDYIEGESPTEYHRFLALVLKGGNDSNETKEDLRGLVVLDVDNIAASQKVFLINNTNTWGHGNQDRVDYYDGDMGWFTLLSAGAADEGKFWNEVLTVSAPVFVDGRIILAGYQPDTGTSWVYNVDSQPSNGEVITGDEIPFTDTEFVGGATINNSGPDGQAVIYVGTASGDVVSQDIEGVRWETGVGSGTSPSDLMQILYWKTNH